MTIRYLPLALCLTAAPVVAQETFPATLAGHAYLPAFSLMAPPADAPISGKFTGSARNDAPMSVAGDSGGDAW
jgi:hypothetical protein